jgi:diguanylate cyclase (GGDEF)-like protein
LHWYFALGGAIVIFYLYWGSSSFQIVFSLLVLFVLANIGFTGAYVRIKKSGIYREKNFELVKYLALGQACFDLVLVTIGIHFSGGGISPLPLMYIIYTGLVSVFFSPVFLVVLNSIALVLYCGLMQAYLTGILKPIVPAIMSQIIVNDTLLRSAEAIYAIAMVVNCLIIFFHARRMQVKWQEADRETNYQDRLHALTKVGLGYHETDDLNVVLANEICELLGADNVFVSRWDEKSGLVFSSAVSGKLHEIYMAMPPTPVQEVSLTASVQRSQRTLVVENIDYTPYFPPRVIAQFPTRSVLGIPLYGVPNRRFLGALIVGHNCAHYFEPEEIERAQQAADVAALLISRTRLYEETQHRADLLEQLANQVTNLTSDLHQTTLLPAVVDVASNLLHAQRAALHLYDRTTGEMRCEFSIGLSDTYIEQITKRFNQVPDSQVLRDKAYVLIPDVHQDSRTSPIQDLISSEKFRAYAVFALPSAKGSLGALSIYWDEPRVISSEEILVAEMFAQRAGALLYSSSLYEKASEESLTDALTSLPNRRALDQRLADENQFSGRSGRPYALLMIDLDQFKSINDTFGHPIGDSVLQQVTGVLRHAVRSTDFVSRYGGDEFAIILPNSELDKASHVADKLKTTLAATRLHLPNEMERFISASIGIAVCPHDATEYKKLMAVADQRLYHAKRTSNGAIVTTN